MDGNRVTEMKCTSCQRSLTEAELAVMTQYGFDKCVDCRRKIQK